jgi:redox-sensitive bicupin YhaK (pirin superfamily)
MWCGSSIWHTEASVGSVPARYLQLWITPKKELENTQPYYKIIAKDPQTYGLIAVDLKQDMRITAGWIRGQNTINIANKGYLYIVEGAVTGNNFTLNEGDGAELYADITADFNAHVILFEE